MTIISNDIQKAADLLSQQEVVAIPTETVYGLAGSIFSESAIRKIFDVKGRPLFNPLIVHIGSVEQLEDIAADLPPKARKLADTFWPGPITLVLRKKEAVPDLITAGKDTVAVRMPNHPITLDLLRRIPFPLAAPSANPFNRISPTEAMHVEHYFHGQIQMVLDGGPCQKGLESTIIGFEDEDPVLYRLGSLSVEDIENTIGPIRIKTRSEASPDAPGMLPKHYAPRTKLHFTDNIEEAINIYHDLRIGLLRFTGEIDDTRIVHTEVLSEHADPDQAASNLYSALHKLDMMNLDIIIAERLPEHGLGKSINDRLERASK